MPALKIDGNKPAVEGGADERATRAADKLVELSKLAGGLAHEIRNPLSTLNINLQLLEEDLTRSASEKEAIGRSRQRIAALRREVRRLSDVLDDFLRFARMPKPQLAAEDINEIVREVVRFIGPEARHNRANILTSCGDIPPCLVDRDLLEQAILNIIINAEQAMPGGGDIMIRTSFSDGNARISIADTGMGIPVKVLPHVFEPYYSTKKDGTGLGLSTVKRIVEEHGGGIEVHTEPNKGSCFTIGLPCKAVERS